MKKAFTLVELLIYMGLLTIFLTIVTRLFVATTDVQLSSESTGALAQDSRYIYSRLSYDITQGVDPAVYSISGGNLMRLGGQLNSVGTTISNLSFVQIEDSIQLKFTITSTTQDMRGAESKTIQTTIAI